MSALQQHHTRTLPDLTVTIILAKHLTDKFTSCLPDIRTLQSLLSDLWSAETYRNRSKIYTRHQDQSALRETCSDVLQIEN